MVSARRLLTVNIAWLLVSAKTSEAKEYKDDKGLPVLNGWVTTFMGIATFASLVTVIVSNVVPELKNHQGRILRNYLASHLSFIMTGLIFIIRLLNPAKFDYSSFLLGCLVLYSGISCLLSLNVMSFDIWRTFRKFQSRHEVDSEGLQRIMFRRYLIYAWVAPVLIIVIGFALGYVLVDLFSDDSDEYIYLWKSRTRKLIGTVTWAVILLIIFGSFIPNIYFYVSTAETYKMLGYVDEHYKENKQWFNLYLKLFIVIGCPSATFSVFGHANSKSSVFSTIVSAVIALEAICVFLIIARKVFRSISLWTY